MRAITSTTLGLLSAAYLCSTALAGALSSGVCYSPWHHSSVTNDVVQKDFGQIKQYFSSVRTYHARFSGVNVIDAAAEAGVSVAVGVMMQDKSQIQAEIDAICAGAKRHPSTVQAVYVGNENLKNGDFGSYSAAELVGYINQVKACVSDLKIPVGSVQRINEWLSAADVASLASACDVIGANVYPFFTSGTQTPIEKLEAQWNALTKIYGETKLHISETGWPRAGGASSGNSANKDTTQSFLNDFQTWSKSKPTSYYFMMYDSTNAYGGAEYEKYFGLADTNGVLQVTIPSGDGTTAAPAATQAPTTAPAATQTPSTTAPVATQAPAVTQAPTAAPAATQAPTTVPAATESAAATQTPTTATVTQTPGSAKQNESPATVSPSTGTGADANTTPAPTKRLRKHKKCTERA